MTSSGVYHSVLGALEYNNQEEFDALAEEVERVTQERRDAGFVRIHTPKMLWMCERCGILLVEPWVLRHRLSCEK